MQTRLVGAIYACIRPLARVLLRFGVTYRTFAEVAKRAFVHEALLERDSRGRITNISRVAVRTGLSRKDVRRVCDQTEGAASAQDVTVDHSGPPARVLNCWFSDSRFCNEAGTPRDLPFEGESPTFVELVKVAGGDVPPGAVRAELLRATAVAELENGSLRAVKRYFVPGDFDEKAITILSGILYPMIGGVEHNSNPNRRTPGFIQRFAFGKLSVEHRPEFREWSRSEATNFVESVDDWLVSHGADSTTQGTADDTISGVGVFFFEGPPADKLPLPGTEE